METQITVPGSFQVGIGYLDVETEKTATPDGYKMPNGEILRKRWRVIMAGLAADGMIHLINGPEQLLLDRIGERTAPVAELHYSATREFDEMILRGRFTNARRAHLPEPTWPAMPGAETAVWRNRRVEMRGHLRLGDVPSRDVPSAWDRGEKELVRVHLLRDLAELIMNFGAPDWDCNAWCLRVLQEPRFASGEILTGTRTEVTR